MHPRRPLALICKWIGLPLLGLLLLLSLLFVFVQTGPGKEMLGSVLQKALSREELRIELSGLKGWVPFDMTLRELRCSDADGPFLQINRARLDWSAWGLLAGKLQVRHIGADSVDLRRRPRLPPNPDPEQIEREGAVPSWPLPPLRIQRIEVPRISLGKPLLNESAIFSLQGGLEISSLAGLNIRLHLNRLDRQGLSIRLQAEYVEPDLEVDWRIQTPGKGLLQHLVAREIPPDLDLRLQGKGPLEDWRGRLDVDSGGTSILGAGLGLQFGKSELVFTSRGTLQAAEVLPPPYAELLTTRGGLPFALDLNYGRDTGMIHLHSLQLSPAWGELNAQGTAGVRSRNLEQTIRLKITDLSGLQPLIPQPVSGNAEIEARIQGPWKLPSADCSLHTEGFRLGDSRTEGARLNLRLRPHPGPDTLFDSLEANGTFQGRGISTPVLSRALSRTTLRFESSFSRDKGLDVHRLELKTPNEEVRVSGRFQTKGTFHAALSGDVSNLGHLPVQVAVPFAAGLGLESECRGNWRKRRVSSRSTALLRNLSGLPPDILVLTGDSPRLAVDLSLNGTRLDLEQGLLTGPHLNLKLRGGFGLEGRNLDLSWQLSGPRLEQFGFARPGGIAGPIQAEGRLQGTLPTLKSELRAGVSGLQLPAMNPGDLQLTLWTDTLLTRPQGRLRAELTRAEHTLKLETEYRFSERTLSLTELQVQAPQTELQGGLELDLHRSAFQTELQLRAGELGWTRTFLDRQPLSGGINLQLTGRGTLADPSFSAVFQGQDLRAFNTGLKSLSGRLQLTDLPTGQLDLHLNAKDLVAGGLEVHRAVCSIQGEKDRYRLSLESSGKAPEPYALETAGVLSLNPSGQRLFLSTGSARYAGIPLKWSSPLRFENEAAGLRVSASGMQLGHGRLDLTAEKQQEQVQARLSLADFELSTLDLDGLPPLLGQADLELGLTGTAARPEVELSLDLSGVQSQAQGLPRLHPVGASLRAEYRQHLLRASLEANSVNTAHLELTGRLPAAFSLSPFVLAPENGLQGKAVLEADLRTLAMFVDFGGQLLEGRLRSDLQFSGSLSHPELSGTASLEQGNYQNIHTGTILSEMSMDCRFEQRRIVLEKFTARDGQTGRISARGTLDLSNSPFSARADLDLQQARLVRLDFLDAQTSGSLRLTTSESGSRLSGDLVIAPVELSIPEARPENLEGLRIVRADEEPAPQGESTSEANEPSQPSILSSLQLDLGVDIPSKCFVRGKGLDSEWSGSFRVADTAAAPRINGGLQLVRGHVDFLTKRFELDKGEITFMNEMPPKPLLDIRAVTRSGDLKIYLSIRGPSTDPELFLESEPVLPRDEILARLLFDKDLSSITAIEAVKLALAVRVLTSEGSGEGIMGTFRRSLGLDELEIKSDSGTEDGETVVGMGKYLSEDIYFKVEQGIGQDSTEVSVRIDLTPRISLQTKAGSMSHGLEIFWEYTY